MTQENKRQGQKQDQKRNPGAANQPNRAGAGPRQSDRSQADDRNNRKGFDNQPNTDSDETSDADGDEESDADGVGNKAGKRSTDSSAGKSHGRGPKTN